MTTPQTTHSPDPHSEIQFTLGNADALCERLASEVAAVRDVAPTELRPLHDVIDPEALAALFDTGSASQTTGSGYVVFSWEGLEVTVCADGHILICR